MKNFMAWRGLCIVNAMVGSMASFGLWLAGYRLAAVLMYLVAAYYGWVVWSVKDLVGEGE